MTVREIKEKRNDALSSMEEINNAEEFDADAFESAEEEFNAYDEKLKRAKSIRQNFDNEDVEKYKDTNDKDTFRFTEALNYLQNPQNVAADKREFYADVNSTAKAQAKSNGVSIQGGNSLMITADQFQNAIDVSTEGDDVLFDENGGFIEPLRDKMVLADMGVNYISNLSGDVKFPKQTSTTSLQWENETASGSAQTTTYGNVKLSPNRGYVAVPVSNQMLAQDSIGIENLIQSDIFNAVAHGIDDAAINSGSSGPDGIMDVASEVTTSGSMYEHAVQLEAEVTGKNVRGEFGYVLDTGLRADAKTATKDSGSGLFVWERGDTINGYSTGVTNAAPSDQLIFGNFDSLIIGDFSGVEILVNPYTKAHSGITLYQVNVYVGTAIRHGEAFAYVDLS